MRTRRLIATSLVIAVVAATAAFGQGVGNLGSLPTQFQAPVPIGGWNVADATGGPIPVQLDPNGGPWIKNLTGLGGQPFSAVPGQTFFLNESLSIAPSLPWTDWHEQILNPGWDWVAPIAFLANGAPPAGLSGVHTPGNSTVGGSVDFYFNPLAVGTKIDIRKTLIYNGINGAVFTGTLQIAEFPTPEPASLGMLALGGIALLRRHRRKH